MELLNAAKYLMENNLAFVAVTRKCNCKCGSCSLWKGKNEIDAEKFVSVGLDALERSGFRIIEFTGGEPTLFPGLMMLIKKSKERNFFVQTMTSEKTSNGFGKSGIDLINISVDSYDDKIASEHRKFPNINKRIKKSVELLARHDILLSSTTLLTKQNCGDIEKTVEFVNNGLGIAFSFCPPDFGSNYQLGSQKAIMPSREELIEAFRKILEMKRSGYKIMNTKAYMRDAISWLRDKKISYPCRAGKNIVYIDWDMNVYPCFIKGKICSLEALKKNSLSKIDCNQCCFQCFREPSIFYSARGKIEFVSDFRTLLPAFMKSNYALKMRNNNG